MPWLVAIARRRMDVVKDATLLSCRYYVPRFRERVIVRGRKVWRERWLFGRYFFVDRWTSSPVIAQILLLPDLRPAWVTDDEVHRLRLREVRGYIPIEDRYRPGDRVRVDGIGITGTVERHGVVLAANGIQVRVAETALRPG